VHFHEINYIKLSAIDDAEAKRFFNAAFDWHFNDYELKRAHAGRAVGQKPLAYGDALPESSSLAFDPDGGKMKCVSL
jgi:predicted enzyme related to lactoylglutathione lyase